MYKLESFLVVKNTHRITEKRFLKLFLGIKAGTSIVAEKMVAELISERS